MRLYLIALISYFTLVFGQYDPGKSPWFLRDDDILRLNGTDGKLYHTLQTPSPKLSKVLLKRDVDNYLQDEIINRNNYMIRGFPRYTEIKAYIAKLAKSHSDVLSYFSIGKTYEGRNILCVKISTGRTSSGTWKPGILIDAGIHAREWISVTSALYAVEQLVEYPRNRHILEKLDIYVIPVLNPDGYEFSHLSPETRLWRKTRSKNYNDCKGADLNRNFDINWNTNGVLNSPDPCSILYAGRSSMSEVESQALANFFKLYKGIFKVYLSLHSYGNYIFYPWGFTSYSHHNEALLKCVATEAAKALTSVRNSKYVAKDIGKSEFPASGMSMDYAMAYAGVDLAFTIELTNGYYEFESPTSEITPVGQEFFKALQVVVGYVKGEVCSNLRTNKTVM